MNLRKKSALLVGFLIVVFCASVLGPIALRRNRPPILPTSNVANEDPIASDPVVSSSQTFDVVNEAPVASDPVVSSSQTFNVANEAPIASAPIVSSPQSVRDPIARRENRPPTFNVANEAPIVSAPVVSSSQTSNVANEDPVAADPVAADPVAVAPILVSAVGPIILRPNIPGVSPSMP